MGKQKKLSRRERSSQNAGFDRYGKSRFPNQDDLMGGSNVVPFRKSESKQEKFQSQRVGFVAKNDAQRRYANTIQECDMTFALGPAGCGKTHIASTLAAEGLDAKRYQKIIITRPALGTEDLGALPGDLDEKYAPWWSPVRRVLEKYFGGGAQGKGAVDVKLKRGDIVVAPLQHVQGETFEDAFIIVDEAQNMTPLQMQSVLTRMGENSKLVICGDDEQTLLRGTNGLTDAVQRLVGVDGVGVHHFEVKDIVRHALVKEVIMAYRRKI